MYVYKENEETDLLKASYFYYRCIINRCFKHLNKIRKKRRKREPNTITTRKHAQTCSNKMSITLKIVEDFLKICTRKKTT